MFADRSALLWEIDHDKMTPEQLDGIADHLIARVLGNRAATNQELSEIGGSI